jgi:hypothetical protein
VGAALPDTGFDGQVIVPEEIGNEEAGEHSLVVADGFSVRVDTWEGQLMIADRLWRVGVHALGDQFLIGRGVLDQMEICFEFGRAVRLRFE